MRTTVGDRFQDADCGRVADSTGGCGCSDRTVATGQAGADQGSASIGSQGDDVAGNCAGDHQVRSGGECGASGTNRDEVSASRCDVASSDVQGVGAGRVGRSTTEGNDVRTCANRDANRARQGTSGDGVETITSSDGVRIGGACQRDAVVTIAFGNHVVDDMNTSVVADRVVTIATDEGITVGVTGQRVVSSCATNNFQADGVGYGGGSVNQHGAGNGVRIDDRIDVQWQSTGGHGHVARTVDVHRGQRGGAGQGTDSHAVACGQMEGFNTSHQRSSQGLLAYRRSTRTIVCGDVQGVQLANAQGAGQDERRAPIVTSMSVRDVGSGGCAQAAQRIACAVQGGRGE